MYVNNVTIAHKLATNKNVSSFTDAMMASLHKHCIQHPHE